LLRRVGISRFAGSVNPERSIFSAGSAPASAPEAAS
jgi:hypothetical protein